MLSRRNRNQRTPDVLFGRPGLRLPTALDMDGVTLFGLLAVSAMLVCYAMEDRHPGWILGFAGSCVLGSAYGFLQGAWPFGLVEGIWAVVAFRRWRGAVRRRRSLPDRFRRVLQRFTRGS